MSSAHSRRFPHLLLALAVGLLVRVGCLAGVEYDQTKGDAASYRRTAVLLLEEGVYSISAQAPYEPTAYRPPGYSAFQAVIASMSRSFLALQVVQIALSLLAVVLLARVARSIDARMEKVVLWLGALNPFDAVYSGAGLSECVTTFVFVAVIVAASSLRGGRRLIALGALLGVLCLLRDIYLALIPFGVGVYVLFAQRSPWRRRVWDGLAVAGVAFLVVAPWTIRNYRAFGRVIPVSAGRLGYSLWMGTWATDGSFTVGDATGRSYPDVAFLSDQDREAVDAADPAHAEPLFKQLFVERIRAEPGTVLGRWLLRWPRLWLGTRFDIFELHRGLLPYGSLQWKVVKAGLFLINGLFFLGALLGAVVVWRQRSPLLLATIPLAFTALAYLPLNSFENRYSQPMFPFLTLLVGAALVSLGDWRGARAVQP